MKVFSTEKTDFEGAMLAHLTEKYGHMSFSSPQDRQLFDAVRKLAEKFADIVIQLQTTLDPEELIVALCEPDHILELSAGVYSKCNVTSLLYPALRRELNERQGGMAKHPLAIEMRKFQSAQTLDECHQVQSDLVKRYPEFEFWIKSVANGRRGYIALMQWQGSKGDEQ
jgi:hypothetical protein